MELTVVTPEHVEFEDGGDGIRSGGSSDSDNKAEDVETNVAELKPLGNAGWADAMAKILKTKKPKGKKSIVLSKAKRLNMIKEKVKEPSPGFEIDGETIEEKPDVALIPVEPQPSEKKVLNGVKKKDWDSKGRVKPSVLEKNRERCLAKVATKGVVQLFNAVREHQKNVGNQLKEAGGSERKRERVLKSIDKRAFLDVLMGNSRSEVVEDLKTEPEVKEEDQRVRPGTWQVLRDDFMMGAKFKDWDKQGNIPAATLELAENGDDDDDDDDDEDT